MCVKEGLKPTTLQPSRRSYRAPWVISYIILVYSLWRPWGVFTPVFFLRRDAAIEDSASSPLFCVMSLALTNNRKKKRGGFDEAKLHKNHVMTPVILC
jgi:hypothetical protein